MQASIIHLEETSSTNAWLEHALRKNTLAEGTMVCTDYQAGGRGQGSNVWESERGKNLLASIVIYPDFLNPMLQFHLSRIIALGCFDTLSKYIDKLSLKWPNDIYHEDQKLGGILIENSLMGNTFGNCIAGIGINVNQTIFEGDAPNPVSLIQILEHELDVRKLVQEIQVTILQWFAVLRSGDFKKVETRYLECLYRKSGHWKFAKNGQQFVASIQHVEPSGQLVLETKSGLEKFWFKEVEFILD